MELAIDKPVNETVIKASAIIVNNQESRLFAGDFLKTIKDIQSRVKETFDPIIDKAHEAHKEAIAQRAKYLDPLKVAETEIKSKIVSWETEQEQQRLEKQAKEIEEAQKQGIEPKVVYPEALKVKGQSLKSVWQAEVYDLKALIQAIADGKAPITFVEPNYTALGQQAKASHESIAYRGVKFIETKILSSTGQKL